jgi:hypothetical protein
LRENRNFDERVSNKESSARSVGHKEPT